MSDAINWPTMQAAIHTWFVGGSGLATDKIWWAYEGRPRPAAPYIEMNVQQVRPIGHDWTTSEDNPLVFNPAIISAVSASANTLTIAAHGRTTGDGPVHFDSTVSLPAPLLPNVNYWLIAVDANTLKVASTYENTGGNYTGANPDPGGNTITAVDLTSAGSGIITMSATADTVAAGKEIIRRAQGIREISLHAECFAAEGGGHDAVRILSNVMSSLQLHLYDLDQAGVGVSDLGQAFSQGGVQHLEGHRGSILEPRATVDMVFFTESILVGFDTIIESVADVTMRMRNPGNIALDAIPVVIVEPPPPSAWSDGFSDGFGD